MDNSPLPANTDFSSLPTETVPPAPVVVPKKPKTTLILFGMLFIVLIGAGAFFISKSLQKPQVKSQPSIPSQITSIPTKVIDETANWKTYANEKYGFSIKYPETLKPELTENPNSIGSFYLVDLKDDSHKLWIERNFMGGWMGYEVNKENITIGGKEGTLSVWLTRDSSDCPNAAEECLSNVNMSNYDYAVLRALVSGSNNNKWYFTGPNITKESNSIEAQTVDMKTILSTFKFLD
jgi:hypothetical protein